MKKRKDGRYCIKKTINGKSVYFYGTSPREVYEKIDEYERTGSRPATFSDLARAWENERWDKFAPGTQFCYAPAVKRAEEAFGDVPAAKVEPIDVQILIDRLASQGYSAKVVKTQKTVVGTIFRHGIARGLYRGTNPAQYVIVRRGLPKSTREPPDNNVIEKIKADEWIFPKILLYTGLRRGEALALTYEDVDRKAKTLRVNKQTIFSGNRAITVERTKTDAGKRTVPLPDILLQEIPKGKGSMFTYTQSSFRWAWKKWCEKLDIKVTPHQLRHAYATILHDADIDVKDAQHILGHSTVQLTQNIYTHIDEMRRTATADKLNDFLAKQ